MKKLFFFLLIIGMVTTLQSQNIIGAWEGFHKSEDGTPLKRVLILSEKYQVVSSFHAETGKFIATNGGAYLLEGNKMTQTVEFHTSEPEMIGQQVSFDIEFTENSLKIVGDEMKLTRIDHGGPGALQGAWLMSGRVRDGNTQTRDLNRPRKTMKILSGTRFQWIAYNTETKKFSGTGGGTYTTIDGKYTENIEFFSRDDSRVGASLEFDFELNEGNWHHKGFSSKGDPMHEIWTLRQN